MSLRFCAIFLVASIFLSSHANPQTSKGIVFGPCWDQTYYSGSNSSACPPRLTSASGGPDISTTTSKVSVTSSSSSGTLYMCYSTISTKPTYSRMITGSEGEYTCANKTNPVVGINEFSITGLQSNTQYYTWFLQIDSRGHPSSTLTDINNYVASTPVWKTSTTPFVPGPDPTGVKWNPGHYVKTQGQHCDTVPSQYFNKIMTSLENQVEPHNEIKGSMIIYSWGYINPTLGNYNFDIIKTHLDWHQARNKKLLVVIERKCFGSYNSLAIAPTNLENSFINHRKGILLAYWRPAVMDAYMEMFSKLAEEFDDHPALEMISAGTESCPSFAGSDFGDYSHSNALQQDLRLYKLLSEKFIKTISAMPWNCEQGGTIVEGIERLYQYGMGRTSPDSHDDSGALIFRKADRRAIRDYRGLIAHRTVVSVPNLGGKDDILPLYNIQKLLNLNKVTHAAWALSSTATGGKQQDIINHIKTPENVLTISCPTRNVELDGGCITD